MGFFSLNSTVGASGPKEAVIKEEIEKQSFSVEQDKQAFLKKEKEVEQAMSQIRERMSTMEELGNKGICALLQEEQLENMMYELKRKAGHWE